jgi:hypothetical protein
VRQDHSRQHHPTVGAEAGGRLLDLGIEVVDDRLERANHERQADEDQGHDDAQP